MTRIIAGFAGSRELKVPPSGTRPTSDRVREAIFASLEARDAIAGSRVLDLFAGSGALALEALSRGSGSVTLVEKNPRAVAIAEHNARLVREAGRLDASTTRVTCSSVTAYLAGLTATSSGDGAWDLVFIDPPYELDNDAVTAVLAAVSPVLSEYAIVVLERSSRIAAPELPPELALDRTTKYGETSIHWISRSELE